MTVVFYHADCLDGLTSAWVCQKALGEIKCIAVGYRQQGELLALLKEHVTFMGKVFIVDFSFQLEEMQIALALGYDITILDHHKTAQKTLQELEGPNIIFDMSRSGAEITWDYFFPNQPRPMLVQYVADRDLWFNKMPRGDHFLAYLVSCSPQKPEDLNAIATLAEDSTSTLWSEGLALRQNFMREAGDIARSAFPVTVHNILGVGVVAPRAYASDVGYLLLEQNPKALFACIINIFSDKDKIWCKVSLRSSATRVDVSWLAEQFGGGGHRNAAGFNVEYVGQNLLCWSVI